MIRSWSLVASSFGVGLGLSRPRLHDPYYHSGKACIFKLKAPRIYMYREVSDASVLVPDDRG